MGVNSDISEIYGTARLSWPVVKSTSVPPLRF